MSGEEKRIVACEAAVIVEGRVQFENSVFGQFVFVIKPHFATPEMVEKLKHAADRCCGVVVKD